MKTKLFLSVLALGFIVIAYGQKPTIKLTFNANNNGQYVSLDSILIENLSKGGDIMLYAPDTLLSLDYPTAVNEMNYSENTLSISQNYPNPFEGKTTVNLYLPDKKKLSITIMDNMGRAMAQYENTLNPGNHFFDIYSDKEKQYIFSAKTSSGIQSIKMISLNAGEQTNCKLTYIGQDGAPGNLKIEKAISDFAFNLGDQLRYTGYAMTINKVKGSDVVEDVPQTDEIYKFEITEGIPCPGKPTINYEGQVYNTVLIGSQCWMKDNLNVGIRIDGLEFMSDNGKTEKYCYENNFSNCEKYGGLYRWKEMMQYNTTQGIQGICPNGWHLPTDDEWTALVNYLGGEDIAGGKLKEKGIAHWSSPNTNATNESGFLALPGGSNYNHGGFITLNLLADFWSSTEDGDSDAGSRRLYSDNSEISFIINNKANSHSVRCVMD